MHLALILWYPWLPNSIQLCTCCGLCSRRNRKINIAFGGRLENVLKTLKNQILLLRVSTCLSPIVGLCIPCSKSLSWNSLKFPKTEYYLPTFGSQMHANFSIHITWISGKIYNFWMLPKTFWLMTSKHCQRFPKIKFWWISKVAECSSSGVKHHILAPSFSLLFRSHYSLVYFGYNLDSVLHIYGYRTSSPELGAMSVKFSSVHVINIFNPQACDACIMSVCWQV